MQNGPEKENFLKLNEQISAFSELPFEEFETKIEKMAENDERTQRFLHIINSSMLLKRMEESSGFDTL